MTTPSSYSPFSSDIKPVAIPAQPTSSTNQDDFMIRTMQGDLASMQNNGRLNESIPMQQTPTPSPTQTNNNPKPFGESETSSDKKSSVQQPSQNDTSTKSRRPGSVKAIIAIIIILIICILGLAIYYFLMQKNKTVVQTIPTPTENTTLPVPVEEKIEPVPVEEIPAVEKYSQGKPNYLTIDLSSKTPEEITATIIEVADELKSSASGASYEFIVVDNNNNPVAFPIFAMASKLNLLPSILGNLGEDFSLYFYNDNSDMHLAFATKIKTKDQLMTELISQEKTLATDASFLFLGLTPETKTGAFTTGQYGNYTVRYLNLDNAKNLSIDYTTTDTQLVMGTSKNTLRAALDKITQNNTPAIEAELPSNDTVSTPSVIQ